MMVETAVDIQVRAVESLLADKQPTPGLVHFAEEFDAPDLWPAGMEASELHAKYNLQEDVFEPMEVSYETPVIRLLPGATHDAIAGDIARLAVRARSRIGREMARDAKNAITATMMITMISNNPVNWNC